MSDFRYGDRVRHETYGEGWVENDDSVGTVTVDFDDREEEVGCSPLALTKVD